jgi:hypothetical protein
MSIEVYEGGRPRGVVNLEFRNADFATTDLHPEEYD